MGKKVYEVEDILNSKIEGKKRYFLIKWKGYSAEESTWEPEKHLNCPAIIARYNAKISAEDLKRRSDMSDESDDDATIKNTSNSKKTSLKKKKKSNLIISSPSSSGSMSPTRSFFISSPPRESEYHPPMNKPQGIAKFFKPTAETLPALNSDDLVQGYKRIGSNSQNCPIEISSEDEKKVDDLFSESMKKFQKMLSRVPGPPITIRNDFDKTPPPQHFIYINETLYGRGVSKPDASFLVGCSCYVIDESCGDKSSHSGCCTHGECECIAQNPDGRPAYDADGLLLPESSVIYECNKKCCCSIFNQPCKNRIIQMGRQVSLTIVRMPDQRGWGVIANHDIPRGTFIDLYLGEVISTKEATKRFISDSQDSNSEMGSYLFDLDFNYESGTECEFTLDAYRYGNVSHFFNHSCSPNLKVYPCFIEHLDPRLHSIAFFACRSISKGEQLTFDYMGIQGGQSREPRGKRGKKSRRSNAVVDDDDDDFEITVPSDNDELSQGSRRSSMALQKNKPIKCLCGSSNCRKFIYI